MIWRDVVLCSGAVQYVLGVLSALMRWLDRLGESEVLLSERVGCGVKVEASRVVLV